MSVVNKMLRDLDRRRSAGVEPDQAASARLTRGVAVLTEDVRPSQRQGPAWRFASLVLVLLVSGVGLAVWWFRPTVSRPPERANPPSALGDRSSVAGSGVAQSAAPTPVVAVTPIEPAARPAVATPSTVRAPGASIAPDPTGPTFFRMESTLRNPPKDRAGPVADAPPSVPTPGVPTPTVGERTVTLKVSPKALSEAAVTAGVVQRQVAAAEIVEQAQRLWSMGSREAALALLRDAALLAERDHVASGAHAAASAVLTMLVRTLVPMELAEGRVSQALERLTRLESALAGEADLWALRGNAAQRMGRHHESANAYLAALRLRPDQPRWMLGAAVSLAADGQLKAAGDWAQSARERGTLTPEVAAYLRQLGVNVAE